MVTDVPPTRDVLELFDTFVHGLVGICNIELKLLRVYGRQWVMEPALMPT